MKITYLLMAGYAMATLYYLSLGDWGSATYYGLSAAAVLGFFLNT